MTKYSKTVIRNDRSTESAKPAETVVCSVSAKAFLFATKLSRKWRVVAKKRIRKLISLITEANAELSLEFHDALKQTEDKNQPRKQFNERDSASWRIRLENGIFTATSCAQKGRRLMNCLAQWARPQNKPQDLIPVVMQKFHWWRSLSLPLSSTEAKFERVLSRKREAIKAYKGWPDTRSSFQEYFKITICNYQYIAPSRLTKFRVCGVERCPQDMLGCILAVVGEGRLKLAQGCLVESRSSQTRISLYFSGTGSVKQKRLPTRCSVPLLRHLHGTALEYYK